jgi:diacylglycerol kinase (ATP)
MVVVPAGTGNSNYRAHWGDLSWQRALERALTGVAGGVRMLDLARYVEGGALVVLGAGAGLTAQVLADARDVALTGRDRLQAGLDRALAGYRPYPGRVLVDGTVVHEGATLFANVGGGRYRAWQFEVLPHSALDDGWLDVCVVGTGCGVDAVRLQELMREGRHLDLPDVRYARGRQVVFERTDGEPLCFEHDGELRTDTGSRATLQILPGVLPVLCGGTPEHLATRASVGGARS